MSSRDLQVGQDALTRYNGPLTRVTIVEIDYTRRHSQSGIMFRVDPPMEYGDAQTWYDADWFEVAPPLPAQLDIFT